MSRNVSSPGQPVSPVHWKRTFYTVWASQFLSIMGFSFALPFAPYYIQELGITDPVKLKIWVALFASATAVSLAIFSPIWGLLADRYGRRLMLLRANLAGCVVMSLMGFARSVEDLVFLRLMQGMFTGTMTAAQALVASQAPKHRSGYALGTLSAAVFSGSLTGSALGGVCAHFFGYRASFVMSGLLLLVAALLVLFGVLEPVSAQPVDVKPATGEKRDWHRMGPAMPILILLIAIAFVRQFDAAYVPLLVQEIHGSLEGASLWTGGLTAVGGVAGLLAGVVLGRLSDRMSPPALGKTTALGAALLMAPQAFATGFLLLFATRFGAIFCSGGLDPVFQIWLSKVTPESKRGFVFGWAGTARSVGWIMAPLCAALVASRFGIRAVFLVSSALFLLTIPLITFVVRHLDLRHGLKDGNPNLALPVNLED
ncbi:MAG: MFS transporter [Lentisphaerota bacterium]